MNHHNDTSSFFALQGASGMVLLEFLISSVLAVVVSTMISMALYQMFAASKAVNDMIDISMKYALLQQHLESDLMGVYIPQESVVIKNGSSNGQIAQKIDRIFQGLINKDVFSSMTFITNNSLLSSGKDILHATPVRSVRVVYKLMRQEGQKNSYVLIRQEGNSLDFASYESGSKVRSYEIVSGIKKMQVTYGFYANQDAEKEGKLSFSIEWNDKKKSEGNSKKEQITVPEVVSFSLEFWDSQFEKSYMLECIIPLIARPSVPVVIEEKEKTPEKEKQSEPKQEHKQPEVALKQTELKVQIDTLQPHTGGV